VLTDLDDTLFDHHRATRDALTQVREDEPCFACWTIDELDRRHRVLLEELHLGVLEGRWSVEGARHERFRRLLIAASGEERIARVPVIAQSYRTAYEQAWSPVPGAPALLAAIRQSGRAVVVVTNNQVAEQEQKLSLLGLTPLIDALVTSEEAGCCKPDPEIFRQALARIVAQPDEAVMIGDAWAADIEGAQAAGIRAVWLNRFNHARPDASVPELRSLEPIDAAMRVICG
jgi:HAD superfamily hydrolase (TIGR01662 family)